MSSKVKIIIWCVVFAIGFILLFNSIHFSENELWNMMQANGGSMDGTKYQIYLEQSIIKYNLAGTILSVLGGAGVLLTTTFRSKTK